MSEEVKDEAKPAQDEVKNVAHEPEKLDEKKAAAPEPAKEEESPENINWRNFREARKRERIEREAAEKRAREKEEEAAALRAALESTLNRQGPPHPAAQHNYYNSGGAIEPDGFNSFEETEEQRIERLVNNLVEKRERESAQRRAQEEQQQLPNRVQSAYPDFYNVVTAENLDYIEFHYPELAVPLSQMGDSFEKYESLYKAVKRFVPNATDVKQNAASAQANADKPRSISSTQITPQGENQSSQKAIAERRAANWERMKRCLKGME